MRKMWAPSPPGGKWKHCETLSEHQSQAGKAEERSLAFCSAIRKNEHNPDPNCLVIFISSLWLAATTL